MSAKTIATTKNIDNDVCEGYNYRNGK